MSTPAQFRAIALALEGTTQAPHFDRTAFKTKRIFATLAADGREANFKFTPDEQALKCTVAPDAFSAVPNAWGQQGWTTGVLARLTVAELRAALEMAWRHAQPAKPRHTKKTAKARVKRAKR